jgi:hypothetical protein
MAMKIQVAVFWVVTSCSVVVDTKVCERPCYLHLHGEEGRTTWRHNPEDHDFVKQTDYYKTAEFMP